jgi:hypothetical protein
MCSLVRVHRGPASERRSVKKLVVLGALALFLVSVAAPSAPARPTDCQPVRAIFYTSSDWWRLSQALGADASPCAQYYISIDPLTTDKTQMRPNVAWQVDALGPNFHALAEINTAAWARWVAATGNTWYAAGQTARSNMDAAGFNVAAGDTWAVNEFSSAVRTNAGQARQNMEDFVQGLHDGDGSDPAAQGVVFMVGVGQNGLSIPMYKASLESWLQDSVFWSDMSLDVSDFFQETYGDVRNYAVAGENPATRMGLLDAFLQHPLALATAPNAPTTEAAARTFLSSAYGPLANASWAWSSKYGWTATGSDVMADYISAQTYAMRAYGADTRIGFAWNPLNTEGLAPADFNTQVAGLVDRLAGSIRETDDGDPFQACEATGCSSIIGGAAPVTGWNTFSTWTPSAAAFTSAPQTVAPGTASGPLTVELKTGGVPTTLPIPSTVTLTSSSPTGTFSSAPGGPWTPSLTLTLPPGTDTASFFTIDASPGTPTLTANLGGQLSTQVETIPAPPPPPTPQPAPQPPPAPVVTPAALVTSVAFTPEDDRMHVSLQVASVSGQPLQARVRLAVLLGSSTLATTSVSTAADGSLGVTPSPRLERGCYSIQVLSVAVTGYAWDGASPTQTDCVTVLPAHLGQLVFTPQGDHMHIVLRATDDSGQPLEARVNLALLVGSSTVTATSGTTTPDGWLAITPSSPLERGCYSVQVRSVTAPGYSWDGASPSQTYCVRTLAAHVGPVLFSRQGALLHVELGVADSSGAPIEARVAFSVLRGSTTFASTAGPTGPDGRLGLTSGTRASPGCYRVRVTSVTASGFVWDQTEPTASFCVLPPPPTVSRQWRGPH